LDGIEKAMLDENDLSSKPLSWMGKSVKYCQMVDELNDQPRWIDARIVGIILEPQLSYCLQIGSKVIQAKPDMVDLGSEVVGFCGNQVAAVIQGKLDLLELGSIPEEDMDEEELTSSKADGLSNTSDRRFTDRRVEMATKELEDELKNFQVAVTAEAMETPDSGTATSSSDVPITPHATAEDVPEAVPLPHETARNKASRRMEARKRDHLMYHRSLCSPDVNCPGCLAKTRDKSHYKGGFDRMDDRYRNIVTMDQMEFGDYVRTNKEGEEKEETRRCGYRGTSRGPPH